MLCHFDIEHSNDQVQKSVLKKELLVEFRRRETQNRELNLGTQPQ